MDIQVLDEDFRIVGVLDTYESLLWTDRFNQPGDFEIYTPMNLDILNLCRQKRYLAIPGSFYNMIIEEINVETDSETGVHLIIRGRSLESILDRRIVWSQTTIQGNIQGGTSATSLSGGLYKILYDAFINPTVPKTKADPKAYEKRKVPNFKFRYNPNLVDRYGEIIKLDKTQYTGDQIDVIVQDICQDKNIGYRIWFGYQMNAYYGITEYDDFDFVFELFDGVNRSYEQSELVYVIFSPNFDNIIYTNYLDTINGMKNITLVAGEGEGTSRKTIIVGEGEGFERRELFTDARDLQSSDYGKAALYEEALKQRGLEKLYENSRLTSYEGEVEATRSFVYGRDFFMGDIIQIENEYGIEGTAKVIEWVRSESSSGIEVYPTFDGVQLISDATDEEDE